MKAAVAGLTLLVSGCSTKPMFVQVPPSAIESAVSVSMRDSQTAIKQVLVGEGYSALFIGSHETFLQPTSHVALHAYNPNTKEYERSDMAIRQPEQEREQRWQALVTPRFTALSQGYELDARIAQFDWQKPKTLTYIAAQRISESLVHAKNHDQSYDRVVIMQHGLRGSLETIVSSDGRTRLHKITAEQLEAQYPTGSLQHLVKPNGYVLMIVC
ncbi:MAG TPA: hypothetical protein VK158_00780, partial [Acidobacteriota bacterium]|nr:hypothetical protein [Acidobacteriota bacterium]